LDGQYACLAIIGLAMDVHLSHYLVGLCSLYGDGMFWLAYLEIEFVNGIDCLSLRLHE